MHRIDTYLSLDFGLVTPATPVSRTTTVAGVKAGARVTIAYPTTAPAGLLLKGTCMADNSVTVTAINSVGGNLNISVQVFWVTIDWQSDY